MPVPTCGDSGPPHRASQIDKAFAFETVPLFGLQQALNRDQTCALSWDGLLEDGKGSRVKDGRRTFLVMTKLVPLRGVRKKR